MKLLFITQKLHGQDAFTALWIKEFIARGYDVTVICLEWKPDDMHRVLGDTALPSFAVFSLGKESGKGRLAQIFRFLKLTFTLRYDRVFIHMTPVWGLFGAPAWILRRKPVYLWYTHYKMQAGLWLLGVYGKRLFCATEQSLPHYNHSPKKVVTGHGIDRTYWPRRENHTENPHQLLMVHRLARSKRVELSIRALMHLHDQFTLEIFGQEVEPAYAQELKDLVATLGLSSRVRFGGSVPMQELATLYASRTLILNMASETIDKTMLEAMTCGCYPITTQGNAAAIGIPMAPAADTPEAIAACIEECLRHPPMSAEEMDNVVTTRHSLHALIARMDSFMKAGT